MGVDEVYQLTHDMAKAWISRHGPIDKLTVIDYLSEELMARFGKIIFKGYKVPQSVLLTMWDKGETTEYWKDGKTVVEITTSKSPKTFRID